jgi:hypothetical protein
LAEEPSANALGASDFRWWALLLALGVVMGQTPAPPILKAQYAIRIALELPNLFVEVLKMLFIRYSPNIRHALEQGGELRALANSGRIEPEFGFHPPIGPFRVPHFTPMTARD